MNRGKVLSPQKKAEYEDIVHCKCCSNRCLLYKVQNPQGSVENSVKLIAQCRDELDGFTFNNSRQIKHHIRDIVKQSCVDLLDSGIWKHNFVLGIVYI